jgi:hypothetical protein
MSGDEAAEAAKYLAGVPGTEELPSKPASLSAPARKGADADGSLALFGEYLVRCFHSKVWSLREAALKKVGLDLNGYIDQHGLPMVAERVVALLATKPYCLLSDRIAQVALQSISLLKELLEIGSSGGSYSPPLSSQLDMLSTQLAKKLGHNQVKIRTEATAGLVAIGKTREGGQVVAEVMVRKMEKRDLHPSVWRPTYGRLTVLTKLVNVLGPEVFHGGMDVAVQFVTTTNTFAHSRTEVRDAGRDMLGAMRAHSPEEVDEVLQQLVENGQLRPKQVAEFEEAFSGGGGGGGGGGGSGDGGSGGGGGGSGKGGSGGGGGSGEGGSGGDGGGGGDGGKGGDGSGSGSGSEFPANNNGGQADASGPQKVEKQEGVEGGSGGGDCEDEDGMEDSDEDIFRDMVSKDLDDNAYSVDKAHDILIKNFALQDVAIETKAAVLEDWVLQAGIDVGGVNVRQLDVVQRNNCLQKVAQWLYS